MNKKNITYFIVPIQLILMIIQLIYKIPQLSLVNLGIVILVILYNMLTDKEP